MQELVRKALQGTTKPKILKFLLPLPPPPPIQNMDRRPCYETRMNHYTLVYTCEKIFN